MESEKSFYEKFKDLFPDVDPHTNKQLIGRIVNDSQVKFSGGQIVKAFEEGNEKELLAEAMRAADIDKLWIDYLRLRASPVRGR